MRMPMPSIDARDRLILALDFPNDPNDPERPIEVGDAYRLVEQLDDLVRIVKIGWPLYMAAQGHEAVERFKERRKGVFLDFKFGDISETVKRIVAVAKKKGVDFLTVNTSMQAVEAATKARGDSELNILTVTLLTSLDASDLKQMGVQLSVDEFVRHKVAGAQGVGCNGVVASGREARWIREMVGPDFLIVTPGIRPPGSPSHDHKRTTTPSESISAGADYLVIGRPVTLSRNPRDTIQAVLDEMQRGFDTRRM